MKFFYICILTLATCLFTACQRYPYLYYYVMVQDKEGNNLLCDSTAQGMINVHDIEFECHYSPDSINVFKIKPAATDSIDSSSADSTYTYDVSYAEFMKYDNTHIMIDASAPIGVKLEECPMLIIKWPDSSRDTLQIDNKNGTFSEPKYYINGVKQSTIDKYFIVITK